MTELELFNRTMLDLECGNIRVAEKKDGRWVVNTRIKEIILSGFRLGRLVKMPDGIFTYTDKDTFPVQNSFGDRGVRIVPGGSAVRRGAFLDRSVVVMPPAYVNVGAFVGENTMIDSHALVGSCAQVGCRVHLSAASQLGGVLEPVGALPVIIEDDVFIGGNCGIYEGTLVQERAVIGSGVIINSSTALYDATKGGFIPAGADGRVTVPAGAVVVSGSRPITRGPGADAGIHVYTPVIIKYRDEKTAASVTLEDLLR